jgi:hypothetical protein
MDLEFFAHVGRLMTIETTAAASRSSKSKSTPADFCRSRFRESDRACEFSLAITAGSYR